MHQKKFRQKLLVLFFLFAIMAILSACAGAAEEPVAPAEEPAAPEEPAEPIEPGEELPVAYGQDSRTELFQHPDSRLKEMAASVAILVHSQKVNISGNSVSLGGFTLNDMSEMGWLVSGKNAPMCSDELFISQPAPGFCTGFLVDDDILITAGHCLQKATCSDTNIVFGFQMESENALAPLSKENVFRCTEVIAQVTPKPENQYLDYAIIKLDRSTGRAGLVYASEDLLEAQNNVAVLGHPSGLPMKIASGAFVIINQASDPFFITNLDTFGSNSGSPVINTASYQVEGILVRGEIDYVLSEDGSCVQVNSCPESGGTNCAGENATKIAMLADQIREITVPNSKSLNCVPSFLSILVLVILVRLKTT
ncbi:MAG: serine protease [Anaerolineales bacterium]